GGRRKAGRTVGYNLSCIAERFHQLSARSVGLRHRARLRDGVEISELPLRTEIRAGALYQQVIAEGKPTRVVTKVDGDKFSAFWLDTVASAALAENTSLH